MALWCHCPSGKESLTGKYSRGLFGGSNDLNPAQQQRRARENAAQRAMAKAKAVIAERGPKTVRGWARAAP